MTSSLPIVSISFFDALFTIDDALPANSRVLLVSPYWLSAGDIHANITAEEKKRGGEEKRRKMEDEKIIRKEVEWQGKESIGEKEKEEEEEKREGNKEYN